MKMLNKINKKQSGFTLLELLVVVGIIAIIGGAMIASFAGNEVKAARGVATQTIAGLESTMRIFEVEKQGLPNNLESLVCAPYAADGVVTNLWTGTTTTDPKDDAAVIQLTASAAATTNYKFGGLSNVAGVGGGMSKKLAQKFVGYNLDADQAEALNALGMTSLRYAIAEACDYDATGVNVDVNGASADFGTSEKGLAGIDIPNLAFSDPRPDGTTGYKLRGVGFEGAVATGTPVLRWWRGSVDDVDPANPTSGYNNIKVGAGATDILIALGIGQDTDFIGIGENARMSKAPFYGQVPRDKYAHYIGLFNLSNSTIRLQAVVDARGDFLDEEIAEFQGQKT